MAKRPPLRVLGDTGADTVRGIVLVNICYLLLTIGDLATVWALPMSGLTGALVGRGLVGGATVGSLAFAASDAGPRGWRRLVPVRARMVLLRSLIHTGASMAWYVSWDLGMPLAESYAVAYAAPLLMTLLAVPLLGERLTRRRVAATVVGFVGMLVMLRPGGALWTPISLILLAGVGAMTMSRVWTRVLATTETPECLAFWLLAVHVPIGLLLMAGGLPLPRFAWGALAGLAILGVSNGLAHWLHSRASALAPVGAIAPYEYTPMLWAIPLGFVLFAQVPSWGTLIGSMVVAGAGVSNFYGEHRRSRSERAAAEGGPLATFAPAVAQRPDQ